MTDLDRETKKKTVISQKRRKVGGPDLKLVTFLR